MAGARQRHHVVAGIATDAATGVSHLAVEADASGKVEIRAGRIQRDVVAAATGIDQTPLLLALAEAVRGGTPAGPLALAFHRAVAQAIRDAVAMVVASGLLPGAMRYSRWSGKLANQTVPSTTSTLRPNLAA